MPQHMRRNPIRVREACRKAASLISSRAAWRVSALAPLRTEWKSHGVGSPRNRHWPALRVGDRCNRPVMSGTRRVVALATTSRMRVPEARRRRQGERLTDAHTRGIERLEQGSTSAHSRPDGTADRGSAGSMSGFQERLRSATDRTKGSFRDRRIVDRSHVGSREPRSSAIRNLCKPRATVILSGNGRSGVAAPIESGDVISELLRADIF